jgi:lipoprotein-anchoring transpeptidase ErfK/SrfK
MSDGSNGSRVVSTRCHVDYVTLYSPADNGAVEDFWGDPEDACQIVISKQSQTITMCDSKGGAICSYLVSVGRNFGNKQCAGDLKTPEGVFSIEMIHDASDWGHDSNDGNGYVPSCYGNWFMRLKTPPHRGIGIHGTHAPESIGTRATEGCIRLKNSDLDSLYKMVRVGTKVTILPSLMDQKAAGIVE